MKIKMAFDVLALCGLSCIPAITLAQAAQDKSADVRTVTGCLAKSDKAGEFVLTASDGSTWEIRSKTVKLADHVGHTVTITGNVWHPDTHGAKEKVKDAVDPNATEHGHMGVTDISMVSDSCKK
jgi:hypothetical protein